MNPPHAPTPPPPAGAVARWRWAAVLIVGLGVLITVGWALAELLSPTLTETGLDHRVTSWLVERREPWLTVLLRIASAMADLSVAAAVVVLLGLLSLRRTGRWRWLWLPSLSGAGGLIISAVVKVLTIRDRPPLEAALVDAYGYAFPSGHALRAVAVYGALGWLAAAAARKGWQRGLAGAIAALVILGVGLARIYLGAHWLTDVLAGYALGGAWLALVLVVTASARRPAASQPSVGAGPSSSAGAG